MRHPSPFLGITLVFVLPATSAGAAQDPDDKLAQRVAGFDKKLVKAFEELAIQYDKEANVEAASFFSECALGLGSKDDRINPIKLDWELRIYLGKTQGGKVLEKVQPIRQKLDSLASEYKKVVDDLVLRWMRRNVTKQDLSADAVKILRECVVKYELTRGAHEYIRTTQRLNDLRSHMGLRSVLWDFDGSRKAILAAWYGAETGDLRHNESEHQSKVFNTEEARIMLPDTNVMPTELKDATRCIRASALVRQNLMNANSRRLWLGQWTGSQFSRDFSVTVYEIPLLPFREDIATPSQRYERGTVVKDWVDTEETIDLNAKKVPFVRYPYPDEPDAPWAYHDGQGSESGWRGAPAEAQDKCGIPIMLRFFGRVKVTDVAVTMMNASGKSIECEIYQDGDKRVGLDEWPTILMLPKEHLTKASKHTVTLACRLDGVPLERTWSFTTRSR